MRAVMPFPPLRLRSSHSLLRSGLRPRPCLPASPSPDDQLCDLHVTVFGSSLFFAWAAYDIALLKRGACNVWFNRSIDCGM